MAISLTHFGEALIARIANDLRSKFLELAQLRDEADAAFLSSAEPLAHRELQLLPYGSIGFDGASRVDLVVRLAPDRATAFEVKLGNTRLSKSRIDDEWLCGCDYSHGGKRFRGNMMSILERKFPQGTSPNNLRARLTKDVSLNLAANWFVVAKDTVLKTWTAQSRPAFSDRVRLLSFESIIDCYGGKSKFNSLVRDMLSFDYYEEWISRNNE